jgi:ElaB/YqjD/DUF883 family membrane-anchored ribosome-binding protein
MSSIKDQAIAYVYANPGQTAFTLLGTVGTVIGILVTKRILGH